MLLRWLYAEDQGVNFTPTCAQAGAMMFRQETAAAQAEMRTAAGAGYDPHHNACMGTGLILFCSSTASDTRII